MWIMQALGTSRKPTSNQTTTILWTMNIIPPPPVISIPSLMYIIRSSLFLLLFVIISIESWVDGSIINDIVWNYNGQESFSNLIASSSLSSITLQDHFTTSILIGESNANQDMYVYQIAEGTYPFGIWKNNLWNECDIFVYLHTIQGMAIWTYHVVKHV